MEWRCAWCGKPHESDDPPCEHCGHGEFERMVVPLSESVGPEQLEWVCTECGRSHPRNSPPCSRCGNSSLERRELDYGDLDLDRPGYLDLASPGYLLFAAVVVALAVVVGLGALGVVDLPVPGAGPPTVSDVPGRADEAGGLSLEAVEREFVAGLDERRRDAGHDPLEADEALAGVAEYLNQRYVKAAYGDGERPDVGAAFAAFDASCPESPTVSRYSPTGPDSRVVTVSAFDSESELAAALTAAFDQGASTDPGRTTTGADVHVAPDGSIHVTRIVC